MTSIYEALRALEKKWRETANMLRSGASSSKRGDEGDRRRREGLRMDLCADELAALLTTRQEVAPCAFAIELADGSIGALGWVDYSKFDRWQSMTVPAAGTRYVLAYRGTGQTSDARDAARYRWLRDRAINFGLDDEKGTPYCVYGLGAGDATPTDGEELDNMIDHCAEIDADLREAIAASSGYRRAHE